VVANVYGEALTGDSLATVISLSGGALLANLISVILLIAETVSVRR